MRQARLHNSAAIREVLQTFRPLADHDELYEARNRPEDLLKVEADEDGNGADDVADTLRYLVATKTRTIGFRKLWELQEKRRCGAVDK